MYFRIHHPVKITEFSGQFLSDKEPDKVIGYMSYYVDLNASRVERFGLMSFDPGNPVVDKEVFNKLEELISKYHSLSWRAVGDNHTLHNYINFCKKMNGDYFKLTDALVDEDGNWVDDYIFEIINPEIKKG